ncbi:thioredoxin-domain-containing protein [Pleomassaria siparia CBS 279.74]|uniref:Thioredoxin-domain-containing protein n=1 Tax=Pleomassaria siparia CBS 279.74 TaxID=1314801 RepID=A0A6G1JW27_9PLEO|nr:thioredoxin-domain-containing protein [Pleomassaria siparia CBS 279.74]
MSKITVVTSASHFSKLLSSSSYTIVDFYADWCGPCKQIAPVFAALADKESKPGKIQFCKVDVDSQQEIAQKYGVSAMPTFLVLKSSSVVESIRGANPSALKAAVNKAVTDAARGPAASAAAFKSKGYTLGSATTPSRPVNQGAFAGVSNMLSGNGGLADVLVRFVGLYVISLFAFDSFKAAEESTFNIRAGR